MPTISIMKERPGSTDELPATDSVLSVVTGVQRLIDQGKLVPGQRLLEAELMARFAVSRPAVREALRFLAGEGLIELIQKRGGRVTTIGSKRLSEMLTVFSAIFRAAVETLVSKPIEAAARRNLNDALSQVIHASQYGTEFDRLQATFNYYYVVAANCGNDFCREALNRLHIRHYTRQEGFDGCLPPKIDLVRQYTAINKRLLARDAEGVYALWKPSLERLSEHLQRS